jgi:hypothetical protein
VNKDILSIFTLDASISFSRTEPVHSSFQLSHLLRLRSEFLTKKL